jgi:hypothetical protein
VAQRSCACQNAGIRSVRDCPPHSEAYFIIYFMRKQFYARTVSRNYSAKCKKQKRNFSDKMKKDSIKKASNDYVVCPQYSSGFQQTFWHQTSSTNCIPQIITRS